MINAIELGMEAMNALTMALMAASSFWWDEADREDWPSASVIIIQIGVLCGRFVGVTCEERKLLM